MIQAFFIFCLWPLAALAGPGDPAPSQADAYREAGAVHLNGADESLRDSTGKAMRALVALGDRDLVGAVSQAYKAYGAFRGAENLDVARKREILARASMASAGTSNLSEEEVHFLQSSTSYRRLDPTFLEKGEYAKVAEEFEKKTGMNRADFLSMLTNFSEKKILTGIRSSSKRWKENSTRRWTRSRTPPFARKLAELRARCRSLNSRACSPKR